MPTGDIYDTDTTTYGSITAANTVSIPSVWTEPIVYPTPYMGLYQYPYIKSNNKGGDDMRYLYEVILVNPKNDDDKSFIIYQVIAKSETSALMKAYDATQLKDKMNEAIFGSLEGVDFDDLKTSCRVLMEWKKEKSLKKAIETIKEAVE